MSDSTVSCGEAAMRLLAGYGVRVAFGIPGVHTLDLCRGMSDAPAKGKVRHVQARNELGAGFMAEGWARATGEPGVAVVISGPGVTNATTALGQCYADSLPLLLVSAEPPSSTLGMGTGVLHEITEQRRVTEPLCAYSATARRAADVPTLVARAFALFASARPRPVHISLPLDVQAERVDAADPAWQPRTPPRRPQPDAATIAAIARRLESATRPLLMVGAGAADAGAELTGVAEATGAIVVSSIAGKGIVADDHPLSLSASTSRPVVQRALAEADVVLAVGTELAETDSFVERLELRGDVLRVDIDATKIDDLYPAHIGLVADARAAMATLGEQLRPNPSALADGHASAAELRGQLHADVTPTERQHMRLLDALRAAAPRDTVWSGDACQLVYTGAFAMPTYRPRHWFYPSGYCALGSALPNAIGAKLARPEASVIALVGDGGFMFTVQELLTAAEAQLALPVIVWDNGGYRQIRDDMDASGVARVGVAGLNPDFVALAEACCCHGRAVHSADELERAVRSALEADRPTVIAVREADAWLTD